MMKDDLTCRLKSFREKNQNSSLTSISPDVHCTSDLTSELTNGRFELVGQLEQSWASTFASAHRTTSFNTNPGLIQRTAQLRPVDRDALVLERKSSKS